MRDDSFKILMIGDSYHELFAREIIDALDAKVELATTGEQALTMLADDQACDLVLLEIDLPKMDGREVLKSIRSTPRLDTLPLMVLTGSANQNLPTELLELGANDFVEKGCAPEVFMIRLRAQMRQKQVLDRLTKLALDRDIFSAGVLHDIRNIETTILANCDLIDIQLRKDPVKHLSQILTDVSNLRAQVVRLGAYADDVIGKVRGNFKEIKLQPQNLEHIGQWVEQAISHDQHTPTNPLTWDTPKELMPVVADEHLLRLIILNIFQNSIKYAKPKSQARIVVTQTAGAQGKDGQKLIQTKFRDFGIGVKPEELRRIFQPFFRGQTEQAFKGSGLGLALASSVAAKMRGQIWAETPADQDGVTICLELPQV